MNPRGMPLQNATVEDDKYKIDFSQSNHMSWPRVTGRALRVLDDISPEKIKKFEVANLNGGLGMYKVTIDREAFSKNKDENLYKLAVKNAKLESYTYIPEEYEFRPKLNFLTFSGQLYLQ